MLKIKFKLLLIDLLILTVLGSGMTAAYHQWAHIKPTPTPEIVKNPTTVPNEATSTVPVTTQPTQTTPPKTTPTAPKKITPTPTATVATLDQTLASINASLAPYGVTATLAPATAANTGLTWSTLTSGDASTFQRFSPYLIGEFTKYPKNLVANSTLKTINLVKSLQVSGMYRAAAPAPGTSSMVYDVNSMTNAGEAYAREVVSHEYWHFLDYEMTGNYYYTDSQWSACNTPGFTYGNGGVTAYNGTFVNTFHPQAGFITAYATYGIEEDRAEMFGWLMYSPSSVKNLNDSRLTCKINRLTTIVHQLSPSMTF